MKKSITYPNRKFRITVSLIAAFYILFHGRSLDFKVFETSLFYIAFTISFLVSILMVKWIHYMTILLDKYSDWFLSPSTRTLKQFMLGVLVPILIDFGMMSVYFYFNGNNIFENGFIRHDFPVIICFILLLNAYYVIWFLYRSSNSQKNISSKGEPLKEEVIYKPAEDYQMVYTYDICKDKEADDISVDILQSDTSNSKSESVVQQVEVLEETSKFQDSNTLSINHDGLHAHFSIKEEILYFYRDGRKTFLLSKLGKEYPVGNISISDLEKKLQTFDFAKIKRSALINCDAIRGYSTTAERDTFCIILKKEYDAIIPKKNASHFLISREYLNRFKGRFHKI